MDDLQLIRQLGQALTQAVEAQDWPRLQQADRAIARLLHAMAASPVSAEKRQALQALQQHHQQMYRVCETRRTELEEKMRQHQSQRDGRQAYALFSQEEEL